VSKEKMIVSGGPDPIKGRGLVWRPGKFSLSFRKDG
jgi:hypothetical protein